MNKITLAIETSCDDTSISILEGIEVISLKTFSQIKNHAKFGGVIPEVASRLHSEFIFKIIDEALNDSYKKIEDIDQIAVTSGPGFVNTLQVGILVAKTLALVLNKPIYEINHIEAHAYSPFIGKSFSEIPSKAIVVIVSGGHSEIFLKEDWEFKLLGKTRDDSIGEAYDKVAKKVGYNYPGGAKIDEIAQNYEGKEFKFPISNLEDFDFSYSGIKSFFLRKYNENPELKEPLIKGFQIAAINQIINKIKRAIDKYGVYNLIIGGGVSANSYLRQELKNNKEIELFLPKLRYTTDNAAMIGYLAALKIENKVIKKTNLKLDAKPKEKI